ncbi:hypothetical protein D9M68_862180 [compost metagenome]
MSVTGLFEVTRSVSRKACRKSPRNSRRGVDLPLGPTAGSRITMALPNSWISLPSEFERPRLAVAWVVKPCGETERMRTSSTSTVSVSG